MHHARLKEKEVIQKVRVPPSQVTDLTSDEVATEETPLDSNFSGAYPTSQEESESSRRPPNLCHSKGLHQYNKGVGVSHPPIWLSRRFWRHTVQDCEILLNQVGV